MYISNNNISIDVIKEHILKYISTNQKINFQRNREKLRNKISKVEAIKKRLNFCNPKKGKDTTYLYNRNRRIKTYSSYLSKTDPYTILKNKIIRGKLNYCDFCYNEYQLSYSNGKLVFNQIQSVRNYIDWFFKGCSINHIGRIKYEYLYRDLL